ncbi:MAG: dephospho-CoA kinase [Kiloniellales bacterium]|nr:dephospho-CoA kinase [Kiloniellales bacterium]
MVILGLTGSIAMGKSTAAKALRRLGLPVHDADAEVHRLLSKDPETIKAVRRAFPKTVTAGRVDRKALGARVFGDPSALRRLEAILHPKVRQAEAAFLRRQARRRATIVVLDIPLLFETGAEARCDAVLVVSAPAFIQAQRVLRRPGMSRQRLDEIRARQLPDAEKRRRADFVIPTGLGKGLSLRALRRAVRKMAGRRGRCWPPIRHPNRRPGHA